MNQGIAECDQGRCRFRACGIERIPQTTIRERIVPDRREHRLEFHGVGGKHGRALAEVTAAVEQRAGNVREREIAAAVVQPREQLRCPRRQRRRGLGREWNHVQRPRIRGGRGAYWRRLDDHVRIGAAKAEAADRGAARADAGRGPVAQRGIDVERRFLEIYVTIRFAEVQ